MTNYIYKLRCNIAHLRYNQDDISVNWGKCVEALVEIIYSIYKKCDTEIVSICTNKGAWKPIGM